jgi:hypothetical protein
VDILFGRDSQLTRFEILDVFLFLLLLLMLLLSLDVDLVVSREDDQSKSKKGVSESFFGGLIKKRLKDFSRSSSGVEKGRSDVFVNGVIFF